MDKPYAWVYREYDTNGELRAEHVWTFMPSDINQWKKSKDVHHIELIPLRLDDIHKQTFNRENKYDIKKLVEAYAGH